LLVTMVALLLTGFVGVRLLRGFLVDQADERLASTVASLVPHPTSLAALLRQQDQLPNPLVFVTQDAQGQTLEEAILLPEDQSAPELPELTLDEAADREGDPFTVPAIEGGGSWRVLASPAVIGTPPQRGGSVQEGTLLVATSLDDVDATVDRLVRINVIVGALVLGGLAVAGYLLVRTALRPLTEIEQTAGAIARGDLTQRVSHDDPGTEVGRLGGALNAMLNQIESAFRAREASEARARRSEEQMRQFVADASHELRTPLTSIRGFAELHRQGAVTDTEETSRLLRRIEDEATRMGLLVEDLLLLARLDQQRPLERRPVDLVVVAADVVQTVRARTASREIDFSGEPGIVVAGDEPRLRQVTTNLVDNALTHTPDGTPVAVRVARTRRDDRDMVALEVCDWGPGLSDEQVGRVFERFYRTDAARSRAQGGTGLGLSIVAAITAAHGGSVEVEPTSSAPPQGDPPRGPGATFRVLLPLHDQPSTRPPPDAPQ
jgi:two-component system OmpR family sensor kinase